LQAVLVNTVGGVTGGKIFDFEIKAERNAQLASAVYANLNRTTRPESLELCKGSAQRALTAT